MNGLRLIGGALVLGALAGCGKVRTDEPSIESKRLCARASAEYAAALEMRVRLTTYRRDQGQFRHSDWATHFLEAWKATEESMRAAYSYRAAACSYRGDIPSDVPTEMSRESDKG